MATPLRLHYDRGAHGSHRHQHVSLQAAAKAEEGRDAVPAVVTTKAQLQASPRSHRPPSPRSSQRPASAGTSDAARGEGVARSHGATGEEAGRLNKADSCSCPPSESPGGVASCAATSSTPLGRRTVVGTAGAWTAARRGAAGRGTTGKSAGGGLTTTLRNDRAAGSARHWRSYGDEPLPANKKALEGIERRVTACSVRVCIS